MNKLLYCLFLISYALHAQQFRNLIIFIGTDGRKNFEIEHPGALSQELALAIISQSAPILIQKELYAELMGFKFKSYRDIETYSDEFALLEYMKRHKTIDNEDANGNFFKTYIFYQLPLMLDNWYFFDCSDTSFLLLLPKKYMRTTLGYTVLQHTDKENEILGLNLSDTILLPLPQSNHKEPLEQLHKLIMEDYLKNKTSQFKQADLGQIIKVAPFDSQTQTHAYCWNIVCSGHGLPATEMVGLPTTDFKKMLTFFNAINTNVVYYSTCFGGAQQLQSVLNDCNGFNFDLISSTALDTTNHVDLESNNNWTISTVFMPEPDQHFDKFFQAIEAGESLEKIGALLAGPFANTYNVLAIVERNNTHFLPRSTDPNVKIVTRTQHLVHVIEQKPITIDERIAVIYPEVVSVPINLSNESSKLVLVGNKREGQADIVHYFQSLQVKRKKRFLQETFINDFEYARHRTLFIKELLFSKKRKTINNVVFKIPKKTTGKTPIKIFMKGANNMYYRTTNFKDRTDMTVEDCVGLLHPNARFDEFGQQVQEQQFQAKRTAKSLSDKCKHAKQLRR